MAISAVSAPVPIAGFIAVAAAEFVATWLAARAIESGCAAGTGSDIGRAGRFLRFHVGGDCGYADGRGQLLGPGRDAACVRGGRVPTALVLEARARGRRRVF